MEIRNKFVVNTFLLVLAFILICCSKQNEVKKIDIFYVDRVVHSINPIACDMFEYSLKSFIKSNTIEKQDFLVELSGLLERVQINDSDCLENVRTKCFIHYSYNIDTICISLNSIKLNSNCINDPGDSLRTFINKLINYE